MGTSSNKNLHAGHRARVKENVLKNGFTQLEDHRLLELLLFYSIPREDTNEIAHRLLDRFGSFTAIIKSTPQELMKVSGVGENTAILLSSLFELYQRVSKEVVLKKRPYSSEEIVELAAAHFLNEENEKILLLCFDNNKKLIFNDFISSGDSEKVEFDIKKIVGRVIDCNAPIVVIAHNHPGFDKASPSGFDISTTIELATVLRKLGVILIDHIIVANNEKYSMRSDEKYKNIFC